jgi:hypothetical protein
MYDAPPPHPPEDPAHQLQRDIHYQAVATLRGMLPPLVHATPEDWARRDRVALATVAAMVPCNPAEARLAALHVATLARAKDCLAQVARHTDDVKTAGKLRAQAASMGRESRGYLGALFLLQSVRVKREAKDASRNSAGWAEHCVLGLMTEALEGMPAAAGPVVVAASASAPAIESAAETPSPPPQPRYRDYNDWSDEVKRRDRLSWETGRYAVRNTMRVKLIRRLGGLPPDCDFEPPSPELLHGIIHGTRPNLRWADTSEPWVSPAAE